MFGYQVAISLAATILIPCAIGCIRFHALPMPYKLIVMLLGLGFFTEVLMFSLPYFGINNLINLHIYTLGEIILLSMFFIHQLKSAAEKRIVWITMVGVSTISLVYASVGNNITGFNSLPRAIECIYFAGLCSYVFYEILLDPEPAGDGLYFVNGAILFYFTSCFIVFAFSKYKVPDNEGLLLMYNVHSIVNAICNIAYALGLWIVSKSSYSAA